jgi:Glycosyl hydrolases family 18
LWRTGVRVVLITLAASLLLFLRGCVFRPSTSYAGSHFNQGRNAVWLGVEWVNEPHSDTEIVQLATELARRQIRYVFVYTTYLRTSGDFNPTFAHATDFIKRIKAATPTAKILAWIGLPLAPGLGTVDLRDRPTRQKIVDLGVELVHTIGFDGVHLDPEILPDGDPAALLLLDEIRPATKPALLSIATRAIQPIFPDAPSAFGDVLGWHSAYYRTVAERVDQIAVMAYDSTFTSVWLYREWMRFQVIGISKAVNGTGAELLFGVPASEEATATHRPDVENIGNGLQGVLDGLNDLETVPGAVHGVAIYPYWETDSGEWSIYDSLWLK